MLGAILWAAKDTRPRGRVPSLHWSCRRQEGCAVSWVYPAVLARRYRKMGSALRRHFGRGNALWRSVIVAEGLFVSSVPLQSIG